MYIYTHVLIYIYIYANLYCAYVCLKRTWKMLWWWALLGQASPRSLPISARVLRILLLIVVMNIIIIIIITYSNGTNTNNDTHTDNNDATTTTTTTTTTTVPMPGPCCPTATRMVSSGGANLKSHSIWFVVLCVCTNTCSIFLQLPEARG